MPKANLCLLRILFVLLKVYEHLLWKMCFKVYQIFGDFGFGPTCIDRTVPEQQWCTDHTSGVNTGRDVKVTLSPPTLEMGI